MSPPADEEPMEGGRCVSWREVALMLPVLPLLLLLFLLLAPGTVYYQYLVRSGKMGAGTAAALPTAFGFSMVFWVVVFVPIILIANTLVGR